MAYSAAFELDKDLIWSGGWDREVIADLDTGVWAGVLYPGSNLRLEFRHDVKLEETFLEQRLQCFETIVRG